MALRNIRREAMDEIKKQVKKSEITEDDQKQLEKELQDLTDKRCKEVDELTAKKGAGADGGLSDAGCTMQDAECSQDVHSSFCTCALSILFG